jgi:hypothetical protein
LRSDLWLPGDPEPEQLREWDELARHRGLPFYAYGAGAIVNPDGTVAERLPWVSNAYGNEGKTEVLNVVYRGSARTGTYHLGLATNGSLTDATIMSAVTEPSGGYARIPLVDGSWSAPSDPGDGNRQISHSQVTFGPASAGWAVTYVFGTTALTGTAGLFLFYIAQAATVNSGQSFLYTLRMKTRSA